MSAIGFCSECGERLKVKRVRRLPFSSFCVRCSPHFRRLRLMLIAVPVLCAVIGFAVGHYTGAREPFHFIGTPVDLTANRAAPSADINSDPSSRGNSTVRGPEQLVISPSAADTTCGAQTKSGKPCRRKVRGGGYCWQHRDGLPLKKEQSARR